MLYCAASEMNLYFLNSFFFSLPSLRTINFFVSGNQEPGEEATTKTVNQRRALTATGRIDFSDPGECNVLNCCCGF